MTEAEARELVIGSVLADPACVRVLEALGEVGLPDAWLCAGAVFQNVWNRLSGFPAGAGIRDYDVFYFDAANLSWDAEDAAIDRLTAAVRDPSIRLELRNQARVHLWYPERFGKTIPPYVDSADAIASFAAFACSVGVRFAEAGASADAVAAGAGSGVPPTAPARALEICAPFGWGDTVDMVLRPNHRLAPREVYEAKAAAYAERWPRLRVEPW
ncbi:hypothetical protein DWB68_09465 [Galactobacter valiniphilus]|uniref:Nucleotidyltransferase family protein n=1 Tax=Galactobacter valiniphilus TaxID=2676122 RepID=A0A399J8V8_9MICC|nr:nucleotidyltransferase family protein [Galactobacter valiniphilus]RII42001.1 hypothetical protein DWB68_09465 [Galactobacter valiniphilus]